MKMKGPRDRALGHTTKYWEVGLCCHEKLIASTRTPRSSVQFFLVEFRNPDPSLAFPWQEDGCLNESVLTGRLSSYLPGFNTVLVIGVVADCGCDCVWHPIFMNGKCGDVAQPAGLWHCRHPLIEGRIQAKGHHFFFLIKSKKKTLRIGKYSNYIFENEKKCYSSHCNLLVQESRRIWNVMRYYELETRNIQSIFWPYNWGSATLGFPTLLSTNGKLLKSLDTFWDEDKHRFRWNLCISRLSSKTIQS